MQKRLIIVDDFYDDPESVRRMALELEFARNERSTYPGKNSRSAHAGEELMAKLSEVVGHEIYVPQGVSNGKFRLSPEGSEMKKDIHCDHVDWNGVLFLNLPEQCRGGTCFWQHKATGWEEYPTQAKMREAGYDGIGEFDRRFVCGDGLDRSKWDLKMTVPMKFNRLVLFRGWVWHSHSDNFGTVPENTRLIQTYFFNQRGVEWWSNLETLNRSTVR